MTGRSCLFFQPNLLYFHIKWYRRLSVLQTKLRWTLLDSAARNVTNMTNVLPGTSPLSLGVTWRRQSWMRLCLKDGRAGERCVKKIASNVNQDWKNITYQNISCSLKLFFVLGQNVWLLPFFTHLEIYDGIR